MKTYANIYYRARMQAAQREPLHASRERTASEIFVSCEALADYETGRTVPPCDVVQKMVEAYNDPDLKPLRDALEALKNKGNDAGQSDDGGDENP